MSTGSATTTSRTRTFRLPDLGEGLTEAGLVQWLVAVGDTIATDQPIAEVETAKSIVELPSPFAGVVTALHGTAGDTIDVGAPVLDVAEQGTAGHQGETQHPGEERADENNTDAGNVRPAASVEHETYRSEERAGSGNVLIGYGTSERASSGRRRAPRAAAARGQSLRPRLEHETEPTESKVSGPVAVRSPLVRRLARDLGLDVHAIVPTGADGAVTRADVLAAAVDSAVDGIGKDTSREARVTSETPDGRGGDDALDGLAVSSRERLSPLRKAVSGRLSRSRSEIPEATVWVDVDATDLWNLRADMAPAGGTAPSITAILARFVLLALAEHPVLASRLSDDGSELISFDGVNLGVAVDTDRGLLVPVLPRAHTLSVDELDSALREVSSTAREGRMPPERLRGSTFTLNNYGGLGVDGSAAIINHPEVAILGIGRIIERPWVVDGQVVPRRIAQLSLVFDHRVCDGGYAASFLRRVTELIEHPLRAFGRV
ncbi:branched-chain alpha-keto acid dehydrogenase subunit E2 [Microbacterium sp. SZ1]|uniref:dihydrolipoamide acetyltransferase family protein n=1 Tax=Microbacterium sp. SZ1 TaxID=1849736 RepID=UPI000BBC0541|nr:dihydrolipoamide acetyltransferase family protein [Microbacterium sp. SZ1]PCE14388.1 branched-chain alpha-keto acid dehydrogenase subunit E2 [Microbacterium sp. SZ1]